MAKVKIQDLEKEVERMNPKVMIPERLLPEIKKWEVGKTYKVQMELYQDYKMEDDGEMRAGFEIKKVSLLK